MAGYDAPVELRTLEKMLNNFTYSNGFDISTVFDDWLRFIVNNFNTKPKPDPTWKYTKDQNLIFHNMMCEWIQVMDKQIEQYDKINDFGETRGWYDVFGELYEACVAGKGRRSNSGQFFTPAHLCDLMTKINCDDDKIVGKKISDPTCGSGRTLLSFHVSSPGNYLYGEDLDRTCCLMTVANFIILGCVGEVVWHNSLIPDSWSGGWRVNEQLNRPFSSLYGIPHMREIEKKDSYVIQMWENRKQELQEKSIDKENTVSILPMNDKNISQLSLFE